MEWVTDKNLKQQGMTLVEVLASLVILSLLAVTFLTVFTTSQLWIINAGKRVQANEYASAIIENIRANSEQLTAGAATYTDNSTDNTSFSIPGLNVSVDDPGKFIERVTVSQYLAGNSNLYKVEVKVTWTQGGANNQVVLSTVVGAR